jgi:hypothetical protein
VEVALLALVALFVKKATDWLKYLTNRDWNGALTQAVAWGISVASLFLAAESELFETFGVNDVNFGDLNGAGIVLVGLALGSGASGFTDWLKARDNTDSARMPSLIPEQPE